MLNFFIGFAFFEFGALCGFFVAALMQAARDGGEIAGRNRTKDIQHYDLHHEAVCPDCPVAVSVIWDIRERPFREIGMHLYSVFLFLSPLILRLVTLCLYTK